ncbi:MAG: IS66 family transposase [Cyanobacteria bacterium P01_G01_bin.49]
MAKLDKDDLAQMNENYFKSLPQERLVEVAKNLHLLATDLWEKQQRNSSNSSQPPSKNNPYNTNSKTEEKKIEETGAKPKGRKSNRKPGKQTGSKGFGRAHPLKAEVIIPHYPHKCSACNQDLKESESQRYMGYYVLELEPELFGFRIVTQLHHYYQTTCSCGHRTHAKPGTGAISVVEGRSQDLQLTEYVLVGAFLATFIASLSVRYRMSRTKIQEFLKDWTNTELSIGTIDRCIREAGIACVPVVEELVEQLQQADILHLDETHWYESGKLHWLWVAVTTKTAVFHIGSRRKEELSHLVTEAFLGWLITDGYAAYRSHPKRQRCLAHLIRKAIAITGAINQKAAQIGQWILDDLKELIAQIAEGSEDNRLIRTRIAGLRRVCHLGKKADHTKLQALAKEIFNDWDAVIAFVHHPELPPTNNEAERALRHAVIARQIGFGTRTREGSLAYSSLLSVVETCRLRDINPWIYIAKVLALARKGLAPPPFPVSN